MIDQILFFSWKEEQICRDWMDLIICIFAENYRLHSGRHQETARRQEIEISGEWRLLLQFIYLYSIHVIVFTTRGWKFIKRTKWRCARDWGCVLVVLYCPLNHQPSLEKQFLWPKQSSLEAFDEDFEVM